MLRWFRKYNKYILSIGASVLMIAFLVPQSLQMLGDTGRNYTLGTIGEQEIHLDDQRQAASDLQLLSRIFSHVHPQLPNFTCNVEPMNWVLMTHEARQMQLSAGDRDAAALLAKLGYNDMASMNELLGSAQQTIENVYRVVADWIMVESYKELVAGRAHTAVAERINEYATLLDYLSSGNIPPMYIIPSLVQASQGRPRMSTPVLLRAAADQVAQATIEAVSVGIDQYLSDVQEPGEAKLTELFDQYKNDLAGESKPYGFGYRMPDRVKIEFLAFPFDRLVNSIDIDESEVLRYYDQNPSEFTITPPETPETPAPSATEDETKPDAVSVAPVVKRYPQVRQQIIDKLSRAAAQKLARQIAGRAQSLLQENLRGLATKDGYRTLPTDWQPVPMPDVAAKLQKQFNVLANVTVLDKAWLNKQSLSIIAGIGTSRLSDNNKTGFVDYAMGVRECKQEDYQGPLLQTGVPSSTLSGFEGSFYIFRVIEAASSRIPDALDQVRAEVIYDARRLAAYDRLRGEQATWQKRLVAAATMQDMAKQLATTVTQPKPFPRRTPGFLGSPPQVPSLDALGQSADVVDHIFDLANRLAAKSDGKITELPPADRSLTIANDSNMTLCLVRLAEYQPLKHSDYERFAASGQAAQAIQQSLVKVTKPLDPFGYDALVRRTGYKTLDK